ncbi:MAG: LamG domain-containing protein [SAR202 cluster bacterium]|nr:LamG domain-containing protein [SAR202 cluster bacterium]
MDVIGYSDRLGVRPGETIKFMVSSNKPTYKAEVVRLVHGDTNPKGPGFKEKAVKTSVSGEYKGRKQAIPLGSYAIVGHSPLLHPSMGFTLAMWVMPTTPGQGEQALLTKGDAYGLHLDAKGALTLRLGGAGGASVSTGKALRKEWYFVAASYESRTGNVTLTQRPVRPGPNDPSAASVSKKAASPFALSPSKGEHPLVIAASRSARGKTSGHFNGRIDRPRVFSRTLTAAELDAISRGAGPLAYRDALVAAWDFSLDITSDTVTDTGPNRLHGRVVNMPARAIPGYNYTGRDPDWKHVPEEYGAIHFHDDDLDDAGWDADFELTAPASLKSGVYAAKLTAGKAEDYIPFFVRAAPGKESKILFLAPTNSYLAYANEHVMNMPIVLDIQKTLGITPPPWPVSPQDKYVVRERLNSLYDYHSDGSYVHYSSRLRPIANMRPKYHMQALENGKGSPHQFNADMHLVDWLEEMQYDYDVATDEDLHYEGLPVLAPYNAVVTGSHPEYWSRQMLQAMQAYLDNGGRLMYLGGNGFYWVTSYPEGKPHIVEVRKSHGTGTNQVDAGEWYHSTTGELGGIWRNSGYPPQKMLGVGFAAQGIDRNAPYHRLKDSHDPRAAFIFKGIGKNEKIGDFPSLVMEYGAGGFEVDRADHALGTPAHALVMAVANEFSDAYQHVREENVSTTGSAGGTQSKFVRGDMVFFETPNGGGVFSVGSISWCGSLSYNNYDNTVSKVTGNVLTRFAKDEPL